MRKCEKYVQITSSVTVNFKETLIVLFQHVSYLEGKREYFLKRIMEFLFFFIAIMSLK